MDQDNRVVVLIDMDCFYCQVEEKLNPELKGKPIAVVQYNPWKGGGIIAVNYVARAMGVTRHMRGDEAREKCPEIELPSVPCQRGKADITKYRDAGKEVATVLQRFTPLLERASIDEAYLDITDAVRHRLKSLPIDSINTDLLPNTYALGYDTLGQFILDTRNCANESIDYDSEHTRLLLVGAVIVSEMRLAVYNETGYQCSAGIAHNKTLAKLICGMNKPNKQTVLPKHSVNILYRTLSIKKVKHLGGKFGENVCDILKISKMCELQTFSEKDLRAKFDEKNGSWLYNIARGVDREQVQAKFNSKSIGCCKQLRGKSTLTDLSCLKKWLKDLSDEIETRLDKDALENNRSPKQMVVSYACQLNSKKDVSSSRSYNFSNDDELCSDLFYTKSLELILENTEATKPKENEENRTLKAPIKFLGISVGKFEDNSESKKRKKILDYFAAGTSKGDHDKETTNNMTLDVDTNISKHKKNKDSDYIMQKFLQTSIAQKPDNSNTHLELEPPPSSSVSNHIIGDKESFFAKYMRRNLNKSPVLQSNKIPEPRSTYTTTHSEVAEHGNNSNDSDYSGSTINEEINKSITLFDDDHNDVARVSDMRNLLKTSVQLDENLNVNNNEPELVAAKPSSETSIVCTECGKDVLMNDLGIHSDYHLAMSLRNEERQLLREELKKKEVEKERKKITDTKTEEGMLENVSSLSKFVIKLNENIVTQNCSTCNRKIPVEHFPEHLDFHEAQRVSRELNRKHEAPTFDITKSVKRKRKMSPMKKTKLSCRPIESFFK